MKKKIFILTVILIIIGLIVVIAKGFNVDLKHRSHIAINVPLGQDYSISDVKVITDEIFGKENVILEKSGVYSDELTINVDDVTDEQLNTLKNKFNEKYAVNQKLSMIIGTGYEIEDVKAIAAEAFNKEDIKVEKNEQTEIYVDIETNLITEQELETLNSKINEKYGLTNKAESIAAPSKIKKVSVPRVRLTDTAKQYLLFTVIATVIVLIYFAIRYKKLGVKNVLLEAIMTLVIAEGLFVSIIAITRIPVNKLVVIATFAVYISVITYINANFMNRKLNDKNN